MTDQGDTLHRNRGSHLQENEGTTLRRNFQSLLAKILFVHLMLVVFNNVYEYR